MTFKNHTSPCTLAFEFNLQIFESHGPAFSINFLDIPLYLMIQLPRLKEVSLGVK